MPTNTRESALEDLIVASLVNDSGYEEGANKDYNRDYALDEARLFRFLSATQQAEMDKLALSAGMPDADIKRVKFLDFLQKEIARRGVIDVLRKGVRYYPSSLIMFYATPTEKNDQAKLLFEQNIFSVTRQLQYSNNNKRRALDFVIFINGLPVFTAELKNRWTKQNVQDAVLQYQTDRDPKELIFHFKRCVAHFAIDDKEVRFCTKLEGKNSWFLPFNKGCNDGAGNPPNPAGLATDYLWKEIFAKEELANIIENYAQIVEETDIETRKKKQKQVFPRYHQLALVEALLADVREKGIGQKYLVQHSAGSGKSNSIAWLAHQLVGLEKNGKNIVDSVLVVTDRRNLDTQIRGTIKQFTQLANTVAWAEHSNDLRKAIEGGKKIIITTIQKFPFIVDDIGASHKGHNFAILIDEAHSSQTGNMSAKMNMALSGVSITEDDDDEDVINKLIEGRRLLSNASYFAFTATPKNKTLELFGTPYTEDGKIKHRPFHHYSMKQAIEEGFILDVLKNYTPIESYYHLIKTVADDPRFNSDKAQKKLRNYVESNEYAIEKKAEIIVEHFHDNVQHRIKGSARAMVVTGSIERAITYYYAIEKALRKRKSRFKAIAAFTGDKDYNGQILNEANINGFPSNQIEATFKRDPYRILVCADKFQTGYDEPLLQTMYVDKILTDIKAVQTLSRLNRASPGKTDTFVLDFANKAEDIKEAFSAYYKTTLLSDETDPNKLNELVSKMERHDVWTRDTVQQVVDLFLKGAPRPALDSTLDSCAERYKELDEEAQVEFKGAAKSFVRLYAFLGSIIPYGMPEWEKLSIFLTLLIPKLPAPKEDDETRHILETVDLESYRAEVKNTLSIQLADGDAEIDPVSLGQFTRSPVPEYDLLTKILDNFHKMWGSIDWNDEDNVKAQIRRLPEMVGNNEAYKNAMQNSDEQEARREHNDALDGVMLAIMQDCMELYKQYKDNDSFGNWLSDLSFETTYNKKQQEIASGQWQS